MTMAKQIAPATKLWFPPPGDVEKFIAEMENDQPKRKEDIN